MSGKEVHFYLVLFLVVISFVIGKDEEGPKTEYEYVHYTNCDDVRAHNADPIYEGEAGFQRKFDRDGDGIGCEK